MLNQLAGGPDVGAGGDADQQAVIAAQLSCGFDGVFVGDFDDIVHHFHIEDIGDESVADALDLVQAGFVSKKGGDVFGFDGDEFDVRFMFLEEFTHTLEASPAADTGDEAIDVPVHLSPDFRAGLFVVYPWVVGVLELLGDEDSGIFGGHLADFVDGPGEAFRVGGEDQLRAQSANQFFSFFTHTFGHDDTDGVPLESPDEGHADARIAGGGFDDDRVGL